MFSKSPVLTDMGKTIILRACGGETFEFTQFKIGSGELSVGETDETMTAMKHTELDQIPITLDDDTADEGFIKITGSFDNVTGIQTDIRWTELGVFVKDEDNNEYLYAYANIGSAAGIIRAAGTGVSTTEHITVTIAIDNAQNITVNVIPDATYASRADFLQHLSDNNPHGITKEDVGLSNVQNYTVNDMPPTYNELSGNTQELISGEGLSAAFAKIALVIRNFISHIANHSNPHNVKAEQVGVVHDDITVAPENWIGNAAPYTATIQCSAASSASSNKLIVGMGGTLTAAQYKEAVAAKIVCTGQSTGMITLTAFGKKPAMSLPIHVLGVNV